MDLFSALGLVERMESPVSMLHARLRRSSPCVLGTCILASIFFVTFPTPTHAQVESNFSSGGGLRIGWSSTTCNSTIAGAIRYNSGSGGSVDFCNGSTWATVSSGGASAASPDRGIQFNSGNAFAASSSLVYTSAGRIGIGLSTPSYVLSLSGTGAAQTIGMERETTGTAGHSLTILAGGAKSGSTNQAGGDLILSGGTGTGNNGSSVQIYLAPYNSGGGSTTDSSPDEYARFNNAGLMFNEGQAIMFNDKMDGTGSDSYWQNDSAFEIWHDIANDQLRLMAAPIGSIGNGITFVDGININTAGNVAIGTSTFTTGAQLKVAGTGSIMVPSGTTAQRPTGVNGMVRYNTSNSKFEAYQGGAWTDLAATGSNTQIQFNSGGGLGASANFIWNNALAKLSITGDIEYTGVTTDISDKRLKENIVPLKEAQSAIAALKPVSFTMKDDPKHNTELGFIAQDVQQVFPALVKTAPDEMGTMSLNYTGLIAPLVKAVQEQQQQIEALQQRIKVLEEERKK